VLSELPTDKLFSLLSFQLTMYFAIKHVRKKYKKRKEAKETKEAKDVANTASTPLETKGPAQPTVGTDDQIETAAQSEAYIAESHENKESSPSREAHENHTNPQDDSAAKRRRKKYRLKVIFGLVGPFTLQALDTTIIASALPFIAKAFSKHLKLVGIT
jgi:hypothetical protein